MLSEAKNCQKYFFSRQRGSNDFFLLSHIHFTTNRFFSISFTRALSFLHRSREYAYANLCSFVLFFFVLLQSESDEEESLEFMIYEYIKWKKLCKLVAILKIASARVCEIEMLYAM